MLKRTPKRRHSVPTHSPETAEMIRTPQRPDATYSHGVGCAKPLAAPPGPRESRHPSCYARRASYGLALLLSLNPCATQAEEFRIGVLSHRGPQHTLAAWQPTAEYLGERIPEHRFAIVPLDLEGMRDAARDASLDFVVTNGAIYVELEERHGAVRTATLINRAGGDAGSRFGAVIFTRADRSDIQELADLKGKSFVAVAPHAWGGWLMPRHELQRHGVRPEDFKQLRYSGYPFDRLVEAVMNGEADAGAVRTDLLEALVAEGKLRLDELRVLNPRQEPGFPYLLSTPLYPEHAFARLPHVDNELARRVTAHLLLVPADSRAAQTARVAGWTTPLSYQSIHRVLQDLKATPYEYYGEVGLIDAIRQHAWVSAIIALLLLTVAGAALNNARLAARLRRQAGSLKQTVERRTRALAASEERLRLALAASEQGLYDLDLPSGEAQVNEHYARMLGYDPANFHETNAAWLERLHPDDRERVGRSYRDYVAGKLLDYRVEFRQRTAAGGWKWILSVGTVVERFPDGRPLRMLGTHLDINDRKQAELELAENHRRLQTLTANLPGMAYRCRNDSDWTMEFVSDGCLDLVGLSAESLIDNQRTSYAQLIHTDDRERVRDTVQAALAAHAQFELEYRLITETGIEKWVWERGAGVYAEAGQLLFLEGLILDNDARKRAELAAQDAQLETRRSLARAEQARRSLLSVLEDERVAQASLRESEQRLRTIFEQAAVGVALIDSHSGQFIRINRRYCDMLGYSIEEMSSGRTFQEITHPDDLQADLDNMARLLAGEIREFSLEKRYAHKDGSIVWVNLTVSPTWSPGEEPRYHVAVVEDITERYRLNLRQRRMQRALATLSSCNEAMLRAAEEQQVLDEVCRRVVHGGGYRLAWIGLAEQDEARTVRPVAQAGYEAGYLETLNITWSDARRGQGPTGTAIRSGRPATARDIHTNPKFAPWREEAVKRGYGSSVALPLREKDRVFGALNLYAAEPDAFDQAELGLLEELANDLSYGLRTVRARKEQEHAEAALHESEQRLRLFIEHAPAALAMFDRQMRYLAISKRWVTDYHLQARDLLGRSHYEVFSEIPERWKAAHRRAMEGEVVQANEDRFERLDGTVQWLRWVVRPWYMGDDTVGGIVIFTEDISQLKQAEAAMHQLSQAVEQSPVSVVITDKDGAIQYVNAEFEKISGYSRAEALGQNPRILKSGQTPPEEYLRLWDNLRAGKDWEGEFCNRRKDGSLYTERAVISPIRDEGSQITGYLAVKEDITQRKNMEEMLRRTQKLEAVGQLAGGIAHDFNNLLSIINGNLVFLEKDMAAGDEQKVYQRIETAAHATQRGTALVRQLLGFARSRPVTPVITDLNEVIGGLSELISQSVTKQVEVRMQLADDLWPVRVDPGEFQDTLLNLAINARDAMPQGGRFTVTTANRTVSAGDLEHEAYWALGDYVRVSVADTGSGMTDAVLSHVFEPFFTTKPEGKGTGLGLSRVYGFVNQEGGHVDLHSEVGVGTEIGMSFPRVVEDESP